MELLKINGNDYSRYVEKKGVGWTRNDLDSDKTTRTKDGNMRRYKITTKRKLSYKMMNMTRAQLAALDDALSANTVNVTYLDLHGIQTRTFYCSSFSATLDMILSDDNDVWSEASFNIVEV